jgi:hypothetical protein
MWYAKMANKRLEHIILRLLTLLLLKLLNIDVFPDEDTRQAKWYEASSGDDHIVPHGTSDGKTERRVEAAEEIPERFDDSNFLVSDGDHEDQLGAGGEESGAETEKDLGEGKDTRVRRGVSERERQRSPEQHDGHTSVSLSLEVAGIANPPREKWAEH